MSAKNRTVSGVLGGFLGFVGMSAVAGVLVTVAVTPALALSGMTATNTISMFENLPDYLAIDQLSQKSNIYATKDDGKRVLLASFYDQNRVEVSWDEMSQYAKDAAVAGEDPRFYTHGGVDLQGTVRGAVKTVATGHTQGGSSITQQYVKNVLVQKCEVINDEEKHDACFLDATKTTVDRKLKEMRYAIGVEKKYSKDDILRQYLNITGFGGRVYGIEAAASYYFDTSAAKLTLPQAASLIAIVNNPVKFQLDDPESETNGEANGYADNKSRRDYILKEMLKYKKITQKEYAEAVATPIEPKITAPSTGCQTAGASAYFCDLVVKTLKTDPIFGPDEDARLTNFRRGGYDVYTTLDLELQKAAKATMTENVPKTYDGWDVGGVATSVQVGTGKVLAMVQNRDYSQNPNDTGANFTGINYNTDLDSGGSHGFQPGSTYKVFTLAEWLKEGHSLRERVDSRPKSDWGTFRDSCNGGSITFPGFDPKNDADESGSNYSALYSTEQSINTGYIGMAKRLDLCEIRKTAEDFGVHRADGKPLAWGAASVLGTNEIAPLTMAAAYAGIANKGKTCTPIVIEKIIGPDDKEMPVPKSKCTQSVEPEIAAGMAYAMQRVLTDGTAQASYYATDPRVPMIGKTGTTDYNEDTWVSGASTEVATVVGVVSVNGGEDQRRIWFDSGRAAEARHRMWPDIMSVANAKYGGDEFPDAPSDLIYGVQLSVPDVRGKSLGEARSILDSAGFYSYDGGETDSELPRGTVAGTDPSGTVSRGTNIAIYTSNGSLTTLPDVVGNSEGDARSALAGFSVAKTEKTVTDKSQDGIVLSTNPGAGSGVRAGSTVTIEVGKFSAGAKDDGKKDAKKDAKAGDN